MDDATPGGHGPDEPVFDRPLDAGDPRFVGAGPVAVPPHRRRLVAGQGPGPAPANPHALLLRLVVPLLGLAALLVVGAVFFRALDPGPGTQAVGDERRVRAAVEERPRRVCREAGGSPCAWLTLVDGRLLALQTSGPVRDELGRHGIAWCPSSGWFGSNATGSRYDQAGTYVSGPSTRGLDRFHVRVDGTGTVLVDFGALTTGRLAGDGPPPLPPDGPDCETIPFDRDADLDLGR